MKMKKEGIIAILIGLGIGLLVAGGIYRAKTAVQETITEKKQKKESNNNNTHTESESNLSLTINTPEDNSIVSENSITVTGEATKDTYIAIIAEKTEHLIIPSETGQFTQEIKLVKGSNVINIAIYTENGEKIEKTLNIVYTSAEI